MIESNPYIATYNEDAKRDKISTQLKELKKEKITWLKSHADDKRVVKLVNGLVDSIYYPGGDVDYSCKGDDPNTNVIRKWNAANSEDLISIRSKLQVTIDKYQKMRDNLDNDIRAYGGMADTPDLESGPARGGGSSPSTPTNLRDKMEETFENDVLELIELFNDDSLTTENLEEIVRRKIAYIAWDAINNPSYRDKIENYIASFEG